MILSTYEELRFDNFCPRLCRWTASYPIVVRTRDSQRHKWNEITIKSSDLPISIRKPIQFTEVPRATKRSFEIDQRFPDATLPSLVSTTFSTAFTFYVTYTRYLPYDLRFPILRPMILRVKAERRDVQSYRVFVTRAPSKNGHGRSASTSTSTSTTTSSSSSSI